MKFSAHKNRFTFAILSERPCMILMLEVGSESDQAFGKIGCSNVSGVEPFLLCSTTFAFESSDKSLLLSQGYIALGPI